MPKLTQHVPEYTEQHWLHECKPIPNPYRPGMGFDYGDGSCLMYYSDAMTFLDTYNLNEDHLWSIIENEHDPLLLEHGVAYTNVLGYIVTQNTPRFTPDPIPLSQY